jgi:hypothetical protein
MTKIMVENGQQVQLKVERNRTEKSPAMCVNSLPL